MRTWKIFLVGELSGSPGKVAGIITDVSGATMVVFTDHKGFGVGMAGEGGLLSSWNAKSSRSNAPCDVTPWTSGDSHALDSFFGTDINATEISNLLSSIKWGNFADKLKNLF